MKQIKSLHCRSDSAGFFYHIPITNPSYGTNKSASRAKLFHPTGGFISSRKTKLFSSRDKTSRH